MEGIREGGGIAERERERERGRENLSLVSITRKSKSVCQAAVKEIAKSNQP